MAVESAPSPTVRLEVFFRGHKRVGAVEVVEEFKISFVPEKTCDGEQAVGLEPEVIGGKIIYRRI